MKDQAVPEFICEIDGTGYTNLEDAIAAVPVNGIETVIKLLKNIEYTSSDYQGLLIENGKNIIFDMNGFDLNILSARTNGTALVVFNGAKVNMTGTGSLNVTGMVWVAGEDTEVTVTSITADSVCLFAEGYASVTVIGDVKARNLSYDIDGSAVSADGNAVVVIEGNVTIPVESETYAIFAMNTSNVTVYGNVHGGTVGAVLSWLDSSIVIKGNASAGRLKDINGVINAWSGSQVTVDGELSRESGSVFITADRNSYELGDYVPLTTKPGYFTYTGTGTTTVWVKNPHMPDDYICEVEGVGYYTLEEAVAAVPNYGTEPTEIKLLQNINHTRHTCMYSALTVDNGKYIVFDMNGFDLNITNTGTDGMANIALEVSGGAKVSAKASIINPESLNVAGGSGLYVHGEGSEATVTNAFGSGSGLNGAVYASSGGKATIKGNAEVLNGDLTYCVATSTGGVAVVYGDVIVPIDSMAHGVVTYSDSNITVYGNVEGGTRGGASCQGGLVEIHGNVSAGELYVGDDGSLGIVNCWFGGQIIVHGELSCISGVYMNIDFILKGPEDYEPMTTKPGFLTYTGEISTVWVKEADIGNPTVITFLSLTANGTTNTATTTELTLMFSDAVPGLSITDITVIGATRGALSGSGPVYTLTVSDIAAEGDVVTVSVAPPEGYTITPAQLTTTVHKEAEPGSPGTLTINVKSMIVKIGKPLQIPYSWDGTSPLVFSSSNASICGVTQEGVLEPMKAGTTVIMIKLSDGSLIYSFTVTVTA